MSTKQSHRFLVINIFIVIFTLIFFSCKDKPNPVQSADSPQIIKIFPDSIYRWSELTILGKNFGTTQGSVNFKNDTSNNFIVWTDSLIKLKIPYKVFSGNVSISNTLGTSNEVYLKILNEYDLFVSSINPIYVLPNDTVSIVGINFGNISGKVTGYNSKEEKIVLWTDTLVKFIYSEDLGSNPCIINNFNDRWSFLLYEILAPDITSLVPSKFSSGMIVIINGFNFDSSRGNSTVKFNNTFATDYLTWSDRIIKVRVPENINSGYLTVNKPRISSKQIEYKVLLKPIIENITPQLANIGEKISIIGKNFGNINSTVLINWKPTTIVTWSDNLIEAIIPDSCTCGDVYVLSSDSAYSNPYDYNLINCGSRENFKNFNKVKIYNIWGSSNNPIDCNYTILGDTIVIQYDKKFNEQPDDKYWWTIDIKFILKSNSLNLENFFIYFCRFTPHPAGTVYVKNYLDGIDIPLSDFSDSHFTYIINNEHPEKFIKTANEWSEPVYNQKTGTWNYLINRGNYDITNMIPIIITFYK
ncbi:MAG: hypothetical protein EPN82_15585 [Bacteroidetes bacterium]|nr:MAG: hypothetical protein EPN82_15585 [Bacteroidota bacterium]